MRDRHQDRAWWHEKRRRGLLTYTHINLRFSSVIADIGFTYSTSVAEMADMLWVWNPLYNVGYIAIASSLYWHKSFFTIDEKKLKKAWQEKNR